MLSPAASPALSSPLLRAVFQLYPALSAYARAARRWFQHIADIVVQSGAAYALAQLAGAVSLVVPGANSLTSTRAFALQNYTLLVNFPIAVRVRPSAV
jgi:hypothetical protein